MFRRAGILGLLSLVVIVITPTVSHAQKGRDVLYPVTADFRCPLGLDCHASDRTDRIAGDSLGPVTGTTAPGSTTTTIGQSWNEGAYFTATYGLQLIFKEGRGRYFSLDFSDATSTAPCAATSRCRRQFQTVTADHSIPPGHLVPVDNAGRDLANGFYGIAVGQTVAARYWLNFPDPTGADLLWTVRFAPSSYPGSSFLRVTRTGTNTWTVESTAADTAVLESATTSGKTIKVHEGFYRMPFRITVTR